MSRALPTWGPACMITRARRFFKSCRTAVNAASPYCLRGIMPSARANAQQSHECDGNQYQYQPAPVGSGKAAPIVVARAKREYEQKNPSNDGNHVQNGIPKIFLRIQRSKLFRSRVVLKAHSPFSFVYGAHRPVFLDYTIQGAFFPRKFHQCKTQRGPARRRSIFRLCASCRG